MLKDIKQFVSLWKDILKEKINKLNHKPKLVIVQVGDNEASSRYVRNKVKDCEEVGIAAEVVNMPTDVSTTELVARVKEEQKDADGIIVQLPLPEHISEKSVIEAIDIKKDVDGFCMGSKFKPATPKGIMEYLKYCEFDLAGKDVCILGRSKTVGEPLAKMMMDADATVTVVHSKSGRDAKDWYTHHTDLIVSAVGKPKFLNCYSIHVPVIDVGINFINSDCGNNPQLVGDCFNTEDRLVTPVPGGVGLLTRCALLDNVCEAALLSETEPKRGMRAKILGILN